MSGQKKLRQPRKLGATLNRLIEETGPKTPLAGAQAVWPEVVGESINSVTEVVSESEGVLTVRCESSVWAQELEMMSPRLLTLLGEKLGPGSPESLRFLT